MPVLNPATGFSANFDRYEQMAAPNDVGAIIERMDFACAPTFYFINTAETHYPYRLPGETARDLPWLSGLHGAIRAIAEGPSRFGGKGAGAIDPGLARELRDKQIACVEHVDACVETLLNKAPSDTWFMVMSDHGELFGEDGLFGHGPVVHEKVLEVFFLEGVHA
jgi:hypothetical protein